MVWFFVGLVYAASLLFLLFSVFQKLPGVVALDKIGSSKTSERQVED